ncbi:cupin domain-containing protein [Kiloniella laminariae]|uniref:Cupin domain-containing protein n=1 Tax=Kiloniella laminariae TaxID=454162 RepID=A0ABT4LJJ2_9PROT|nr:cupin domain-containing protein [Kiloniella laminariae]MCZ4281115.1 cupin domain-containing protein [Kiloniella laminariae]
MDKYVISKAEIEAMEGLEKTHFLNDNARRNNKSLGDLTGLTGLGFHIIEVPPGCESTEYHVHYNEDECSYVLSGTGKVIIGEEEHSIGPGDFIGYRAGGLAHTMINDGPEPLKCIVVGQRLAHDSADYPKLGKRIYRSNGKPWDLVNHEHIVTPGGLAGKKS